MAQLNTFQKRCVEAEKNLLITACPGSGKTTVLKFRAKNLLSKNENGNLLAVTFTKDAADELKERVVSESPEFADRIGAGTFHSLAMHQLKRAGVNPDLLDETQVDSILRGLMEAYAENIKLKQVKEIFTQIQASMNRDQHPILQKSALIKNLWERYQEIKTDQNKLDFSDLIYQAVILMRNGSAEPFKAKWLLADEAQDMDDVQHAWIQEHINAGTDATLVGDDDQSIYSFRAATGFKGMKNFLLRNNANQEVLPVNYRCGKTILNNAAKLIEFNNPDRIDKPIQAAMPFDGFVHEPRLYPLCDEKGSHKSTYEICGITQEIKSLFSRSSQQYKNQDSAIPNSGDWAVLARGNFILDEIERELMYLNISYTRKQGSFWDNVSVKRFTSALDYFINQKWFGFALSLKEAFGSDCVFQLNCKSMTQLCQNEKNTIALKNFQTIQKLETKWRKWAYSPDKQTQDLLLNEVADLIILMLPYKDKQKESHENIVKGALQVLLGIKGKTLKVRLSKVLNQKNENKTDKRKDALKNNSLHVTLATMHGSKGLEFDNVWLIGCESESFVDLNDSESMKLINEERRLFYVAMTRARHHLFASLINTQNNSIFLQEAGMGNYQIQ